MAHIFIQRGERKFASQLLDSLMQLERMHINEFNSFCAANIEYYLEDRNNKAVRSWFGLWESLDPENPKLEQYRFRLGGWKDILDK